MKTPRVRKRAPLGQGACSRQSAGGFRIRPEPDGLQPPPLIGPGDCPHRVDSLHAASATKSHG